MLYVRLSRVARALDMSYSAVLDRCKSGEWKSAAFGRSIRIPIDEARRVLGIGPDDPFPDDLRPEDEGDESNTAQAGEPSADRDAT